MNGLSTPLADRMRPRNFDEFVGQEDIVGKGKLLRTLVENDQLASIIFWGPPGVGKTTLASIIARTTKSEFIVLSGVSSGKADLEKAVVSARKLLEEGRRTVLFIDEIHRWNKAQQDALLPYVEKGIVTLIGATTENPSFEVIGALLSRSQVFILKYLNTEDIVQLIRRALEDEERGLGEYKIEIESETVEMLAELAGGDARRALNGLDLAVRSRFSSAPLSLDKERPMPVLGQAGEVESSVESTPSPMRSDTESVLLRRTGLPSGGRSPLSKGESIETGIIRLTSADIKEALQRTHLVFDKKGEEFYNLISALHKSMRGSDPNASLYWLARMLEGGADPLYVARRVLRFASEDIGMANSEAMIQANAAYDACHKIGMPECTVHLAQAVVYCAKSKKSNLLYSAYGKAAEDARETSHLGVPLHLRNAPTKFMKQIGYGKEYKYNPDFDEPIEQEYLPEGLRGKDYLKKVT